MKKIDNWLIDTTQECYLVVWDWTGATVGMVQFVLVVVAVTVEFTGVDFGFLFYMTINAIMALSFHMRQTMCPAAHNAMAEWERSSLWPRGARIMNIVLALLGMPRMNWDDAIYYGLWAVVWYVWCAKKRDREPPQWKAFLRPATGSAR